MYKNSEGYASPTEGAAIRNASRRQRPAKPPESVRHFRTAIKLMCTICHVRILGKVTVVDEHGDRW